MGLQDLYQQVILDHAKERHGCGLAEVPAGAASGQSRQFNPLCGDEVEVRVVLGPDGPQVSWEGDGCSISQAATSVMFDLVDRVDPGEASELVDAYREMIRSRGAVEPDEEVLGDAVAFSSVGRHANRVKCAMIGWTAYEAALALAQSSAVNDHAGQNGDGA